MNKSIRLIALTLIILMGAVTAVSALKIETLKANPAKYDGKLVRIRADVNRNIGIPLTDYTIYVLDDQGHRLALLSKASYSNGDRVRLRAQVVAYSDSYDGKKSDDNVKRLSGEMVDHLGMDENRAENFANGVIKIVATISGAIEGVYLLIEAGPNNNA